MPPTEPGKLETCAVESNTEHWTLVRPLNIHICAICAPAGRCLSYRTIVLLLLPCCRLPSSGRRPSAHVIAVSMGIFPMPEGSLRRPSLIFQLPVDLPMPKPQKHAKGLSLFIADAKLQSIMHMLLSVWLPPFFFTSGMGIILQLVDGKHENILRFSTYTCCTSIDNSAHEKLQATLFIKMHG